MALLQEREGAKKKERQGLLKRGLKGRGYHIDPKKW